MMHNTPGIAKFYLKTTVLNSIIWILDASSISILSIFAGVNISYILATVGIIFTWLLMMIPTTPGSWGLAEFFWTALIIIFYPEVIPELLVSIYMFDHILRVIYAVIFGSLALPRVGYRFKISKDHAVGK